MNPENPDDIAVSLVLDILAASNIDVSIINRSQVIDVLQQEQGDIDNTVNELLSQLTIRQLQHENVVEATPAKNLEWQELCSGLGWSDCHAFYQVIDRMDEKERDILLSVNGGFFQQLLLEIDDENQALDGFDSDIQNLEDMSDIDDASWKEELLTIVKKSKQTQEDHPLVILQALFPTYKYDVIEDVYERCEYDIDATVVALENIRSLSHVQSFASIVKSNGSQNLRKTNEQAQYKASQRDAPPVASLGLFPSLPSRNTEGLSNRCQVSAFGTNAWCKQSQLVTGLKIERLVQLLPTVERDVIQSTFYLSGCSFDATEALLREFFNLPVVMPLMATYEEDDEAPPACSSDENSTSSSYIECQDRVKHCWQVLSGRYCSALESFNRNCHVIAADRVRAVSAARKALRQAQYDAATAFVTAHQNHLRTQRPLDLHGLTVIEALRVAREAISVCRAERLRRCILITGQGNHSKNQHGRILSAIQLSLQKQHIAFRRDGGVLYIYPLRSSS